MKIIIIYLTLVNLVIKIDGREFNLARWTNTIDPYSVSSSDCIPGMCDNFYSQKRSRNLDEVDQYIPSTSTFHLASGPWPWFCTCETQYGVLDLGPGNYPRYLADAHCVPKTCHNKFNRCKLIHYKVHILSERELDEGNDTNEEQQYVEQSILPESLRVKWQLKPMKIAVACVAATEGRKN